VYKSIKKLDNLIKKKIIVIQGGKMKNTSIRNKMIRYFSLAVFCIFIVFVSYVILQVYKFQVNQAYQNVEELSQRHAKQIELDFSKRFSFLESMKYSIESGVIKDRAQGISYIKQLAQSNKEFQGIYMLYDPDTFDGKDESFKGQINMASNESGHYNPWWYFDNGQIIFGESTSDYFDEEYYALTKQENKNLLIEPYIDEDIKLLMASFTYPLNKNGQFIGIVGGDVTLAFLDEMISQIKILKSGYAFLLSKEGTFVSFPNKEMIGKQTLEAYSKENNRPKLLSIAEDIKNGKEGILEAKDPFSKKASVFVYKQIGNTGWSIISVIPKNEILENVYALIIGMSIIGLISLIVFIYIAKRIAESITKPILKMTGILEEISQGQGDLTVQIDVNSNDELGKMAHYFNQFVMNLRKIMQEFMNKNQVISHQSTQLNESAGLLTEQSDSIHTDVEQLSNVSEVVMAEVFTIKSAVEQAESNIGSLAEEMLMLNQDVNTVNEASVSTDQLVKKAGQDLNTVSLNIQEIALSVNNLSDEMKSSSAAISEMNSSISEVAQNALSADKISSEAKAYSNDAQSAMNELDVSTREIRKIVGLIEQITDQTNMLALNATIEAASAGEAGKGFAVVANEVKTLAQHTAQATQQIAGRVDMIQTNVQNVIRLFNRTIEIIENLYQINHTIAYTVEQQSIASNEISASVEKSARNTYQIDNFLKQIKQISHDVTQHFEIVQNHINSIAGSTGKITHISDDVSRNAQEAHSGVNEINRSSSQINHNVMLMGDKVNQIFKSAELTANQANSLNVIASELTKTVDSIQQITGKFKV